MTDRSINCHLSQSAMNYLLYYAQPTKTTSIRRTTSIRKQLDALYGHFNTNTKTFTKIIEKIESITIEDSILADASCKY